MKSISLTEAVSLAKDKKDCWSLQPTIVQREAGVTLRRDATGHRTLKNITLRLRLKSLTVYYNQIT